MSPEVVLRKPLVTEKNLNVQESLGQYAFVVSDRANKIEIKNAVESKFDVSVIDVRTIRVKGKSKRMNTKRGMTTGKRPSWKKAIVKLKAGDSIDFFAGLS